MANLIIKSHKFSECEELAEAVKHADLEIIQKTKGKVLSRYYDFVFDKLHIQMGKLSGAKTIHLGTSSDLHGFLYDLNYSIPTITDGYVIDKNSFTYYPPNSPHFALCPEFGFWVYLSIKDTDNFLKFKEEIELPDSSTRLKCYDGESVDKMHLLFHKLLYLADYKPHYFDNPEVVLPLENELVDAQICTLLKSKETKKNLRSQNSSKKIIANLNEYMRENYISDLNIIDICDELGVSLRSLYYAFDSTYKVSPMKFINLYRLNKAHSQLTHSNRQTNSVSRIAINSGLNHLGRFSVEYKKLFGSSPSEVLKY